MLSWRDDEKVYDLAVEIAEESGESKQTAFGRLFRAGIALHDMMDGVRLYLIEQRRKEVSGLGEIPLDYKRDDAAVQEGLYELYPPTDLEVLAWIQQAIAERIEGQLPPREAYYKREEKPKPRAKVIKGDDTFPDGTRVYAAAPLVDERTVVVSISSPMFLEVADVRVGLWGVQIVGNDQRFESTKHKKAMVDAYGRGVCEIQLVGELMVHISLGENITLGKSLLNAMSGAYESETVDTYDLLLPPTAAVVRWAGGNAVRITEEGIEHYKVPEDDLIAPTMGIVSVEYAGWSCRLPVGAEDVIVDQHTLLG